MGDMCCNLPDVARGVLHRGAPVAVRRVDGLLYGKSTGLERPLIGLVGILLIGIEEGFCAPRAPPPSLTKIKESPILISAGAPVRISPRARKTSLRKPTTPPTSSVNTLGIMVGQPSGRKLVISQVSPRFSCPDAFSPELSTTVFHPIRRVFGRVVEVGYGGITRHRRDGSEPGRKYATAGYGKVR